MRLYIIALMLIQAVCLNNLYSQKKIVNLWKGEIPGGIENSTYKEEVFKLEDGKIRIRKVTNPTLTIFIPKVKMKSQTAIVICPGGGYTHLAVDSEGEEIAAWLNKEGITAAVLKYRLPDNTIMKNKSVAPLQDAQEAIRILRRNAAVYNINPDKIGVMGFSAGGHLASTLALHYDAEVYPHDTISAKPDFQILIYPVISMQPEITHSGSQNNLLGSKASKEQRDYFSGELNVTKDTPPAFIVHAEDDKTVPVINSINYFLALKNKNISAELHIYQAGGHGFGLAANRNINASQWPLQCITWLKGIENK